MAIKSYFFDAVETGGVYDRIYNADDFTSYLNELVSNGVFANPSTNLQVLSSSGMEVLVKAGSGWINGCKIVNTADLPLTIDAADPLLARKDAVIIYADWSERACGIAIKKGTPAANPGVPSLTRSSLRWELRIAEITVNPGVTSILSQYITDTRANQNVCGWVAGLIDQIDSSTLFNQWTAAWNTWFSAVQQQYKSKILSKHEWTYTKTNSNPINAITISNGLPQYDVTTDILEVYINGIRLREDEWEYWSNVSGAFGVDFSFTISNPCNVTFVVLKNAIESV